VIGIVDAMATTCLAHCCCFGSKNFQFCFLLFHKFEEQHDRMSFTFD
jgi:hypothetical protein